MNLEEKKIWMAKFLTRSLSITKYKCILERYQDINNDRKTKMYILLSLNINRNMRGINRSTVK
jgi:hypothetical protein